MSAGIPAGAKADRLTFEVQLKDPTSYDTATGAMTAHVEWMTWDEISLVPDPADCEHGETACAECADQWAIEYFVRIREDGNVIYASPDYHQEA